MHQSITCIGWMGSTDLRRIQENINKFVFFCFCLLGYEETFWIKNSKNTRGIHQLAFLKYLAM